MRLLPKSRLGKPLDVRVVSRTLSKNTDGLAKVAGLTVRAVRVFQHTNYETELAKKTVLALAIDRDVRFCEFSDR